MDLPCANLLHRRGIYSGFPLSDSDGLGLLVAAGTHSVLGVSGHHLRANRSLPLEKAGLPPGVTLVPTVTVPMYFAQSRIR